MSDARGENLKILGNLVFIDCYETLVLGFSPPTEVLQPQKCDVMIWIVFQVLEVFFSENRHTFRFFKGSCAGCCATPSTPI